MRSRRWTVVVVLVLAGTALAALSGPTILQSPGVVVTPGAQRPPVYEGRIKDVRAAVGLLVLTVGEGKEAREVRFDIGEARFVGPSGNEWKSGDLRAGDRVRVAMAPDRPSLVQQVSVLSR
jgi:hypothetical protein